MENTNVEQSQEVVDTSQTVSVTESEERVEVDATEKDSTLGKFRDVKALAEAYKNLQSEFTKKCQRLSELEKKDNTDIVPEYQQQHWSERLSLFLENNPEAKNYATTIGEILLKDKVLASRPDSLDLAWKQVVKTHFVDKNNVGQQEDFYDLYVKDNESIKNRIIKEYLENVQRGNVPPLMQGGSSGIGMTTPAKPTTLAEAKEYVVHLFK